MQLIFIGSTCIRIVTSGEHLSPVVQLVTDLGDVPEKPSFPLVAEKKQTPVQPAKAAKKEPAKEGSSATPGKEETTGTPLAVAAGPTSSFSFSTGKVRD